MKLSIIVPVYNSEDTLKKCIDSLLEQTLVEKEIILINDGSKDNSLSIIEDYSKKYKNIVVLNQDNSGQGMARNRGLKIARGEYITFVDSDDYISGAKSYEKLLNVCKSKNLDLLIFNYCMQNSNDSKKVVDFETEIIYSRKQILEKFLLTNEVEGFSCNKIFKKNIIDENKIIFLENQKFEDIPFVVDYIINSNRIAFDNNIIYHYVYNPLSTTRKINLKVLQDEIKSMDIVLNKIKITKLVDSEYLLQYAEKRIKLYKKYRFKNLLRRKLNLRDYRIICKNYREFLEKNKKILQEK